MKRAALTFDDGPSEWTPPILDLLADHDAHATFFVLGTAIAGREATLQRIVNEGHEVAVHGWDHTPCDDLPEDVILMRLADTVEAIARNGETVLRWWRPPWHRVTDEAAAAAERVGLAYCGVTVDAHDVSTTTDEILARIVQQIRHRSIVGLHDGIAANGQQVYKHREHTVEAVRVLLADLSAQWQFVTVSELLG